MKTCVWHLQRSVKGVGKVRGGAAVLCYEWSADSETSITVRDCCVQWHFVCCERSKVGHCCLWFIGCCCCCCCFYGDPAEEWRSLSPLFECQQLRWRETAAHWAEYSVPPWWWWIVQFKCTFMSVTSTSSFQVRALEMGPVTKNTEGLKHFSLFPRAAGF